MVPDALAALASGVCVDASAVLCAAEDLPYVDAAIWPFICPNATLFTILVLTFILSTVGKGILAMAMRRIHLPLALVPPAIDPFKYAIAVKVVLQEFAFIAACLNVISSHNETLDFLLLACDQFGCGPLQSFIHCLALAIFEPRVELANEGAAVRHRERSLSVFHAVDELTKVKSPIMHRAKSTASMGNIFHPRANVLCPIAKEAAPSAMSLSAMDFTMVLPPIRKDLEALTHGRTATPLALVNCAVCKLVWRALH
mmetsp:Transcript_34179/g.66160  ORF Transcript_34179/g.66160 Transcript_34179/m.66160 type:complete len:256 (-) Transcript_34179:325-1092(-)